MNTIQLPQMPWYGDEPIELNFPSSWDVHLLRMSGDDAPPISEDQIREAFAHPIGSQRIKDIARGKKDAVILFDDLTRPTKTCELVPYVLEELREAGISDSNIRFICALGAHGAMNLTGFEKKLGKEIMERFCVYNHNPYENCTFLGYTSKQMPVAINTEFINSDVKIGIGCIVPHRVNAFGGGGKIIAPGIASIDTIEATHSVAKQYFTAASVDSAMEPGKYEESLLRPQVEEIAKMSGLQVKVDALVNTKRETTALFVGDPVEEHHYAVNNFAKKHYATPMIDSPDIIIANAYSEASESAKAIGVSVKLATKEDTTLVVISIFPEGQVTHYLVRSFGHNIGGRLFKPKTTLPKNIQRLFVLSPYISMADADWFGPYQQVTWCRKWEEVLEQLQPLYSEKAKVAIVKDATIQYFPQTEPE